MSTFFIPQHWWSVDYVFLAAAEKQFTPSASHIAS